MNPSSEQRTGSADVWEASEGCFVQHEQLLVSRCELFKCNNWLRTFKRDDEAVTPLNNFHIHLYLYLYLVTFEPDFPISVPY